ncbi:MAG: potassium transporter TrkG [Actinomycetota bacterium]
MRVTGLEPVTAGTGARRRPSFADGHEERLDQRRSVAAVGMAGVAGVSATTAAICLVVELLTGAEEWLSFATTLVLAAALAAGLGLRYRLPPVARTTALLVGVVWSSLLACGLVALPYLVSGLLDPDAAIFEAVAGVTTTSATTVRDPGELGHGLLLWRAASQWTGAAGVVLLVVVALPQLGIGGLDPGGVVTRSARRVAPRASAAIRRLGAVYVGLTVIAGIAYVAVGMPTFEALIHALTTASTGGFSTRAGSLGAFDSAAIEIVAIVVMAAAGTSLPLAWRVVRRREFGALWSSVEFRMYFLVLVVVAVVHLAGNGVDDGVPTGIRQSAFASTSAISTTGFEIQSLAAIDPGAAAILILGMGTGAMAASLSGGFKLVRVMAVYGFVRRELVRQLHPGLKASVRVGRSALSEPMVNRMIGSISLSLGLLVVGALVLSAVDPALDSSTAIIDAVSIAVTSVANAGPADVGGASLSWPAGLGVVGRLTSSALMLVGRVEVTPVLVAAGLTSERLTVLVPRRRPNRQLDR